MFMNIFFHLCKARMQNTPPVPLSLPDLKPLAAILDCVLISMKQGTPVCLLLSGECEVALQWEVSHGITLAVGRAREWAQTVTRVILGGNLRVELCGAGKGSAQGMYFCCVF